MTQADLTFPDTTEEDYERAVSKFVTFPPNAKVGDLLFLDIECGMLDWDTPGQSQKVPVTIIEEGIDKGKEDKLSYGIGKDALWKGKEIYKAITSEDMPMKTGSDGVSRPSPNPLAVAGKPAVGQWQMQEGKKGGVGETVRYPKLIAILPAGSKPKVEDLGIG